MTDGNIAYKVTWVEGAEGPFTTACTPRGRLYNIEGVKSAWCCHQHCPCHMAYVEDNRQGPLPLTVEPGELHRPCNDAHLFDKWRYSGGGFADGTPKRVKDVRKGRLAFFTTRPPRFAEERRIVVGAFRIGEVHRTEFEDWVIAKPGTTIKVLDPSRAPRFWDYYQQESGPMWGSGRFRYLDDETAKRLYEHMERTTAPSA